MLKIHSLQKRFLLYFFVPIALLLAFMGIVGFLHARRVMIQQWEESTILHLEQSAHSIDMLLARPKELVRLYLESAGNRFTPHTQKAILNKLAEAPGVLRVIVKPTNIAVSDNNTKNMSDDLASFKMMRNQIRSMNNHFKDDIDLKITVPHYDADASTTTFSIVARIIDNQQVVGAIEVLMDFKFLIKDLLTAKGWNLKTLYLADDDGHILVASGGAKDSVLEQNDHALAQATLKALTVNMFGTVRGKGFPPEEISGFYRLMEAPWYIVVFAPGREILKPIIQFRNIYGITLALFMSAILFFIRHSIKHIARSVQQLSTAADQIADGKFGAPLIISSHDEIGELTRSFNTMSRQLQERIKLKRSLNLAKEVQQNLIPAEDPKFDGLNIAGHSDFCDETGGDYYDYIEKNDFIGKRIRIFIGDVAGHGISSALLMSGIRASLRQRNAYFGSIEEVLTDVNRQMALDVGNSGRFMTLFCLEMDMVNLRAEFVRAGHERGLLYRVHEDRFETLNGSGIPLGIEENFAYTAQTIDNIKSGDIFVLATDGILEATDPEGNMFGRQRLKDIIRTYHTQNANVMVDITFRQLYQFTQNRNIEDDMTLIVVKVEPSKSKAPENRIKPVFSSAPLETNHG